MALLPLPQRGQPIDYDYMYQLAEGVNKLSSLLAGSTTPNKIDKAADDAVDVPDNQVLIVARKHVINKSTTGPGDDEPFEISFGVNFKYAPVVTITPKKLSGNASEVDVLSITSISADKVKGIINTKAKGKMNVELQVTAIGIKIL